MSLCHPNAQSPVLSDELITEILSWLAVKTLMRLRCVSKSWSTLISDPSFVKMHLKRSARNPHLLLEHYLDANLRYIDLSYVPIPVRRLLENPSSTDVAYKYGWKHDKYHDKKHYYWRVIGSCNGMLCLRGACPPDDYWICLWNPATRVCSRYFGFGYSYPTTQVSICKYAFGYDNSRDTYKVVMYNAHCYADDDKESWRRKVRVFSLADKIWRDIQSFPVIPLQGNFAGLNEGAYVSGTINWLALHNFRRNYDCKDITIEQFVILSLDLSTETYTELLLPKGFNEVPRVEPTIGVLMDCLCFYHDFKGTDFVVWQMKEFGVQGSWTQLLKFSYLQNLQIGNDLEYDRKYPSPWFFPLCVPENGEVLILAIKKIMYYTMLTTYEAIVYNWRDNKVERIGTTGEILWSGPWHYIESLVSIC